MHKITEQYVVEKTVEIVADINGVPETLRIEALLGTGGRYSNRAYIQREVLVEFAYHYENQHSKSVRMWIDYDLPWTQAETADDAIRQAMSLGQFISN